MEQDRTLDQADAQREAARRSSGQIEQDSPEIPGYTLRHLLGFGSFGSVWAGEQQRTGQKVAVKVLVRGTFLRREIEVLREIADHPHVVNLLDADLDHEPPYFVMAWLREGSLAGKRPSPAQAVQWLRETALALQYTHDKGLLHCDLKPSNLLLDEEGHVRVVDFGQSVHTGDGHSSLGTLGYMPPEQPTGTPNVRWDIYALGATFYALLTGEPPRLTAADRSSLTLSDYPQKLAERPLKPLKGVVDADLAAILERCLELDPERRTSTAREVLQDLEHRQRGELLLSRRPWSLGYRARRLLRKPVVAVSLAFLLVLLGTGFYAFHDIQRRNERLEESQQQLQATNQRLTQTIVSANWEAGIAAESQLRPGLATLWWARLLETLPDDPGLRMLLGTSQESPLIWRVPFDNEYTQPYGMRFTPEGKQLLVQRDSESGYLNAETGASGQMLKFWGDEYQRAPDGRIVEWTEKKGLRELVSGKSLEGKFLVAAFDGPDIVALEEKGTWVRWNPKTGSLKRRPGPRATLQLAYRGRLALLDDRVWDIVRGVPLTGPLKGLCSEVLFTNHAVAWLTPTGATWRALDGKTLQFRLPSESLHLAAAEDRLAVSDEGEVRLYALPSGELRGSIPVHAEMLVFDPAGRQLAVSCEDGVRIYDDRGWLTAGPWPSETRTTAMAFSPDGSRFAYSRSLYKLDMHNLEHRQRWLQEADVSCVAYSHKGQLASARRPAMVDVWKDGRVARSQNLGAGQFGRLEWLGEDVLAGSYRDEGLVAYWNGPYPKPAGYAGASPDGRFALCDRDGMVVLQPLPQGKPLPLTDKKLADGFVASWSRNGRFLALYGNYKLALWDLEQQQRLWMTTRDRPGSLAVSEDGAFVADSHDNFTTLVDGAHDKISGLRVPLTRVDELLFSNDSRYLLVMSQDYRASRVSLSDLDVVPFGPGRTRQAVFHPQLALVALASPDEVRLYSLETGRPASIGLRGVGQVNEMQFHPSGQELAVASKRGLLVWTLKPLEGKVREALGRLEEQVGAKLDRQDQLVEMVRVNRWTSYLP